MKALAKLASDLLSTLPLSPNGQQAEVTFLLACLRPTEFAGQCPPNLDWSILLALAADHGVMPLLAQRLLTKCPTNLPVWVQARLTTQQQRDACQGLALLALLLKLWHRFTDAGIQVTTFKGPIFASEVYGNLLGRTSVDLDLLVPLDQVMPARQILIEYKYLQLPPPLMFLYWPFRCIRLVYKYTLGRWV